jgi:hypothetical protein
VIVVVVIVVIVGLFAFVGLARQRETARSAGCRRNLAQIAVALIMYDQGSRHLPIVRAPLSSDSARSPGPLKTLLEELGVQDFTGLADPKTPPPKQFKIDVVEHRVPGFVCPSDSIALGSAFAAPISYRATTGDEPNGQNGPFAPGRKISVAEIGARDGTSFTAAFSERLVGNDRPDGKYRGNYARGPGAITRESCPSAGPGDWHGDAGESWMTASWESTLYNHTLAPNAAPSCIAADGQSARMGASSGHSYGVNVVLFDLSVRSFTPHVDPAIWREWANISSEPNQPDE